MTYSSVEPLPILTKIGVTVAAAGGAVTAPMLPDFGVLFAYMGIGLAIGCLPPLWSKRHRGLKGFLRAMFSAGVFGAVVGSAVAEMTGQPYVAVLAVAMAALAVPDLMTDPFGTIKKILDIVRGK